MILALNIIHEKLFPEVAGLHASSVYDTSRTLGDLGNGLTWNHMAVVTTESRCGASLTEGSVQLKLSALLFFEADFQVVLQVSSYEPGCTCTKHHH